MRKLVNAVTVALAIIAVTSATRATIINIDSRINGDLPSGFPPLEVPVTAGVWQVTPTNPGLDAGATFTAWSQFASAAVWNSALIVNLKGQGVAYKVGTFSGSSNPDAAFADPANVPISFTLTVDEVLQFYVQDNFIADNRGGVSIRLEKTGAVPTHVPDNLPNSAALLGIVMAGILAQRRIPRS